MCGKWLLKGAYWFIVETASKNLYGL